MLSSFNAVATPRLTEFAVHVVLAARAAHQVDHHAGGRPAGLRTANALAIAGGALAAAMLERLIEKNILTVADVKGILDNADSALAAFITLTD